MAQFQGHFPFQYGVVGAVNLAGATLGDQAHDLMPPPKKLFQGRFDGFNGALRFLASTPRLPWLVGMGNRRVLAEADSDGMVDVIIYRARRDAIFEPEKIKRAYHARLKHIAAKMRIINQRANPLESKTGNGHEGLSREDAGELTTLRAALDFELDAMRREVGRAAEESSRDGPRLLANQLNLLGAEIRDEIFLTNAIAATLPVELLAELAAIPDVGPIHPDLPVFDELDVSVEACGFDTWWAQSYTGGGTDFGIVDNGVDQNHPAFSHVPAMYARPGDFVTGSHGTVVTGVVAMDNGSEVGAAYGLDSVVWANGGLSTSCNLAAMQWAAWQAPVSPEVLNFSRKVGVATLDTTDFELSIDSLIDNMDMLSIKSAGNEGWDNTWSTLTSPGRAYNLISVAGMNDQGTVTRADDARYYYSSTGPTPAGRRKPDLTAPGGLYYHHDHRHSRLWHLFRHQSGGTPCRIGGNVAQRGRQLGRHGTKSGAHQHGTALVFLRYGNHRRRYQLASLQLGQILRLELPGHGPRLSGARRLLHRYDMVQGYARRAQRFLL